MLNGLKLIGLCVTKIHDETRSEYTQRLFEYAEKMGYKVIVYNSFIDFYNMTSYLSGSSSVYDSISFSMLDAIVIMSETIYDQSIKDRIIKKAKLKKVPVFLIKGQAEGCISISDDYIEAYKEVIRHVVHDHGARDTFFIAGKKDNDNNTVLRLKCYKDVLEEEGIEFSEDNVGYGDYWNQPTHEIIDELIKREKFPDAVICANDSMAIAACERLKEYGKKVPDDVIVTGFDGISQAEYNLPPITTCREDIEGLAKLTVELIDRKLSGTLEGACFINPYKPHIRYSCGCNGDQANNSAELFSYIYEKNREMTAHEDFIFSKIDAILNNPTLSQAIRIISYLIPGDSFLLLNNRFLAPLSQLSSELTVYEDEYTLVFHSDAGFTDEKPYSPLSFRGIYDLVYEKLSENMMTVVSPVFIGSTICGFYISNTRDIRNEGHKTKRIAKAINISFNDMFNRYKQNEMKRKAEESVYVNQVTQLANLRGSCKWFNDFLSDENNHKKHLSVSVYAIAKYKQLYENYGIEDAENAVRFVSEALQSANPKNCFIGQISENEFVIVNYYDHESQITKTINSATSNFFPLMQDFNAENGKDYYVEVNCGCTVVAPGWSGTLSSLIKFASSELYMNKLRMNPKKQQSEQRKREHDREVFSLLIEQNMFKYCFQPIVDAKTGEIYGYEALMRTPESINMSPLDVLETASQTNRLYDIERATIFNVMEFVAHNSEFFDDKKVFINLIPGYFLNEDDYMIIGTKYCEYIDNIVFEITERNTVTDGELNRIRTLGGDDRSNQVAIDDYGTGHSNIVNLLRYSPQIIKIDRFLISDVDKDVNKQMFIKSTIDFARLNGIKVLAEGVETSEELKTVVSYGVDFIQGYYTGRPVFDPIINIDDSIRQEIISMNSHI